MPQFLGEMPKEFMFCLKFYQFISICLTEIICYEPCTNVKVNGKPAKY